MSWHKNFFGKPSDHLIHLRIAVNYKDWYAQFAIAMAAPAGEGYGPREGTFVSVMVSGVHDDARKTFATLDFEKLSDAAPQKFWCSLWEDIASRMAAASAAAEEKVAIAGKVSTA